MIVPEKWGFCMAGNEQIYCDALDLAVSSSMKEGETFTYYEIGIGNADTMLAAASWLTQRGIQHKIVGVDLPSYSGTATQYNFNEQPSASFSDISLALVGAEAFLANVTHKANFIFIDACHGAPCVTRDFLMSEKITKPGGVICFHDTDPNCQGIHHQDHCGTGIAAREAVEALGLLNDTRPGWKKLFETHGDKSKGGHGALWVQKLSQGQ